MRFLQSRVKDVYLFERRIKKSEYIGTEATYVYQRCIQATYEVADDKRTVEAFGERAFRMYRILCQKTLQIEPHMQLSFTQKETPEYKIISVKPYEEYNEILVEAIL